MTKEPGKKASSKDDETAAEEDTPENPDQENASHGEREPVALSAPATLAADGDDDDGDVAVWHSGDWKPAMGKSAPYNGLEITALPTIADGKFVSAKMTFVDYTFDPKGVTSELPELLISEGRVDVPQPTDKTTDGKAFTVVGWVALQVYTSGLFLRIRLYFGAEHMERHEMGNIFEIKMPKVKDKNARG